MLLIAWYIPPEWIDKHQSPPKTIIEAAQLVSKAVQSHPDRHMPFSTIPLVIHQKWNTARLDGMNARIIAFIEEWLADSISPPLGTSPMAYFLWDDEGVLSLVQKYEQHFLNDFIQVFSPVEKVDIFRVMVCKWFGGIVSLSLCVGLFL